MLVGINNADDAGVYKLTDDIALIQTVDIFTPVVDDPYMYGQIVAANAMSDVYAMGGKPLTALNVVGFHKKILPMEVLVTILKGGFDKASEAGAAIVGGHTIMDEELKYGMSVTGIVHPDRIVTNAGARAGDRLVLTKPLGTGIISTALKAGEDLGALTDRVQRVMAALNRTASEVMQEIGVHACTDITGFGLLGHGWEMAAASKVGFKIYASQVPIFEEAIPLAASGMVPGGTHTNRQFLEDKVTLPKEMSWERSMLLFDAQTSGGLFISVAKEKTEALVARLLEEGLEVAALVGEVVEDHPARVEVVM